MLNLRNLKSEEGFTLIELLVVIVIIGVLAAIALPIFLNQQKAAGDAALKQDIKTVSTTMATWLAKGNKLTQATYVDSTYFYVATFVNDGTPGAGTWLENGSKAFPGMEKVNVSQGTRIGMKITDYNVGYCIAGTNSGGTYNGSNSTLNPSSFLYYDSTVGKIQTRTELLTTGACATFI